MDCYVDATSWVGLEGFGFKVSVARPGACFSKVPITFGPEKQLSNCNPFILKN